jgi:hypothetical protein
LVAGIVFLVLEQEGGRRGRGVRFKHGRRIGKKECRAGLAI